MDRQISVIRETVDSVAGAEARVRQCEVLVIGAGPAGLAAAKSARVAGAQVVVLDEGQVPGGQYYKQPMAGLALEDPSSIDRRSREGLGVIGEVRGLGAEIISGALVWGAFGPDEVAVVVGGRQVIFRPRQIVLATGAYERPLPVSGWTLPGVMTPGAAQVLLRDSGVVAGRRVLVAGTGPLNLHVAAQLLAAGTEVVALVEAARRPGLRRALDFLTMVGTAPGVVAEGLGDLGRMIRAGVPVFHGHAVARIEGAGRAERVHLVALDSWGEPIAGGDTTFDVDTVCLGAGLLPSTELARQLGCTLRFDERAEALVPVRDSFGETTVSGVFAAGAGAALTGAKAAYHEGCLAGLAAARNLGRVHPMGLAALAAAPRRRLRRERRFQRALERIFAAPLPALDGLSDDTVVCRCEDVTLGAVRRRLEAGTTTVRGLRGLLRVGMGRCQGRFCTPFLDRLVAEVAARPPARSDVFRPRPPAKPVPVSAIALEKPEWQSAETVQAPVAWEQAPRPESEHVHVTDVLVIGGGVVGYSLAYFLARDGAEVCLVEGGEMNGQASGTNAGSLHVQLTSAPAAGDDERVARLGPFLRLGAYAVDLWKELSVGFDHDVGLRLGGGLMVAESDADVALLNRKMALERSLGLNVEMLAANEIRRRYPHIAETVVAAEFCPDEGLVNPLLAGAALAGDAARAGARIIDHAALIALDRTDRGFTAHTAKGVIRCARVVNAAGAWSAAVASLLGVALPVRGEVSQVSVTEPAPPLLEPLVLHAGRHLTLKQAKRGNFIIGGGWPAQVGADGFEVSRASIEGNLWTARHVVPALGPCHLIRCWAGVKPVVGDGVPILGEVPGVADFFLCVTKGYTIAPLCARLVAEVVMGRRSSLDIGPYSIGRFA
ncbi:MAG: FAD-dependent oxidoreductase [Rhodospirillales bacterium]|jgi:glycine/D-amino acid oxidase-like deaminating enzyme|nr:FAD-dependent oxidoreductase [Rhodospirillales bacterium]